MWIPSPEIEKQNVDLRFFPTNIFNLKIKISTRLGSARPGSARLGSARLGSAHTYLFLVLRAGINHHKKVGPPGRGICFR